jgi:hypothetical protein
MSGQTVLKSIEKYRWLQAIVLAGVLYLLVGTVFPNPPASDRTQFIWRLAAWIISAVTFGVHAWFELFRLHSPPRRLAVHVSSAVALGAIGLAVAANVHALRTGAGNQQLLILAIVSWPVMTAVPALVIAFIAAKAFAWFGFDGRSKKPQW